MKLEHSKVQHLLKYALQKVHIIMYKNMFIKLALTRNFLKII